MFMFMYIDIALDLLSHYLALATTSTKNGFPPLYALSIMSFAFTSGCLLRLWQ